MHEILTLRTVPELLLQIICILEGGRKRGRGGRKRGMEGWREGGGRREEGRRGREGVE